MALTVATNTGALMAQAAASSVNKEMEVSMERLASGKRINSAADDAAGVAIASRLSAEIRGTNQAIRNAMDGQAMIDTAEGAHIEVENILQRMRELAVQASNDTNDSNDRASLQSEVDALVSEIDRISSTTSWAGQKLLDGSDTDGVSFQLGSQTSAADTIVTTINSISASALGVSSAAKPTFTNITETSTTANKPIISGFDNQSTTAVVSVDENVINISTHNADGDVRFNIDGHAITADFSTHQTASTDYAASTKGFAQFITDKINNANLGGISATHTGTKITIAKAGTTSSLQTTNTAGELKIHSRDAGETLSVDIDGVSVSMTVAASGYAATASGVALQLRDTINASDALAGLTATVTGDTVTVSKGAAAALSLSDGTATNAANKIEISGGDLKFTVGDTTATNVFSAKIDGVTISTTIQEGIDKGFHANAGAATAATMTKLFMEKVNDSALSGTITGDFTTTAGTLTLTKTGGVAVTSSDAAKGAIKSIDVALQTIASQRAELGSVSNRLDSTVSNLTNISSNLQAGRGRIEDADFAAETTNLAKTQILQQASTAMLAQANASKQNVLSLLQG